MLGLQEGSASLKISHLVASLWKTEMGMNPSISHLSPSHSQVLRTEKLSQSFVALILFNSPTYQSC